MIRCYLKKKTSKASKRGSGPRKRGQEKEWTIERIQTGLRIERRLLTVLKALAEYLDITLGDVVESIMLHAFEGKCAFSKETQKVIAEIKTIYGLDLDASAGHHMREEGD